jgi:PST family polysaccharide transporter
LWLGTAAWLVALLIGLAGLLLLIFGGPAWPPGRALVFTGAMLLVTEQALLSVALLVARQRGAYVLLTTVLSALGAAAVAGLLALGQPLGRVLLGYVVGQALTFGLAVRLASGAGLLKGWPGRYWPSRVALRGLARFVLIALGNLLFGRAVEYAVRAYLIAHFAPSTTDLWQAVVKLSDNYTLVVIAVLNTVFYPRLAALAAAPAEQRRYVSTVAGLLAVGLAAGLGLLYALRQPLLTFLFAPRLAMAAPLLAPQLLGDWAKFVSWVFQYLLLVRGRALPYLAMQAGGVLLYTSLLVNILPRLGLPGMVITHATHYSLMLLLSAGWFYFGKTDGKR